MKISSGRIFVLLIAAFSLFIGGCMGGPQVSRVDTNEQIDLSDKWNDTDSRLVADEMTGDMTRFPWIRMFQQNHPGEVPTIIIKKIANKSHQHIAIDTFINDIKRAGIRLGIVEFVVGGAERNDIRDERKQQDIYASEDSRAEMGQEEGADFALSGSINSIVDQVGNKRVTFYQVDLKLVDMTKNKEVWNGQKKIKKLMKKSKFSLF
ncbi:MAG: penicillin-binding protein activator LpoB [Deltaproteobacteria bacterium]|nr:MAG: penicillin-binding protein activator LpoB [Deltaproteobacteria bacterium]